MSQQPKAKASILVVDDHPEMGRLLGDQLNDAGYATVTAQGGDEAIQQMRSHSFDVVITDLRMEGVDGFDVLAASVAADASVPVLIMTAFGAIESAIEAMKKGAFHYFTKPFRLEEVLVEVERALKTRRLEDENRSLRRLAVEKSGMSALVGRSEPMRALYVLIERVAQSAAPVLIRGESGSGKELVARALHLSGPRKDRPFVVVNCTALPEALLESELFGHVRGAFTGASATRRGLFLEAEGGTIFLDEIGDMAPGLQAKLLRTLQDGEVRAVGSDQPRKTDVRIVAATHQDLEERIRDGGFRQDLFYRLNVVPLVVPPLRDRTGDIPLLVEHFLAEARQRNPNASIHRVAREAMSALAQSPWPGNVRELQNVIERLIIVSSKDVLEVQDLETHAPGIFTDSSPVAEARRALIPLKQLESDYIAWVIARCAGNKTRAAEILGIDVSTIHRKERAGGLR
ncbi:MAG: sigma-54-dependent transcriptional regulator [Myxococcaceae bacterium]